MNRLLCLTKRNIVSIFKDVVSIIFIFVPSILMLVLMESIFSNVSEVDMFNIENFAPGICAFGYTFVMLFVALNITTDKRSAFMMRILVSPTKNIEYLFSYVLSSIPLMFCQTVVIYLISLFYGLSFDANWFLSILLMLPSMLFYSVCGILIAAIAKSDTQAGPFSSIIISATGMLGGVWMPIETMGNGFFNVCKALPFYNGIKFAKLPFEGFANFDIIPLIIILAYTFVIGIISIIVFNKTIKN